MWRRNGRYRSRGLNPDRPFEQCACCFVIPTRAHTVILGHSIATLCDSCYATYNSGKALVRLVPERTWNL